MIIRNGLELKNNTTLWSSGEPNDSGNSENVAEITNGKINDIPASISQKSIVEFPDNRNSSVSGYTFVGSFQGHSYYTRNSNASWDSSRNEAISLGGNLWVVNSEAEFIIM